MTGPVRQIIAMGGGGFSMAPENTALDRYILKQARTTNPRVCFVPTASGDAAAYVESFYAVFATYRCRPTHLPFFERTPGLPAMIAEQDVIFVGGGNTKSMLATWHEWKLPSLLRRAWRNGTVLAGVSAGAICWFDVGITDSWADRLRSLPCLGLLPGTCCPHYDGEVERRPALHQLVGKGVVPTAIALDDFAAAHYSGRTLLRVVSSRPTGGAYLVHRVGRRAVEVPLPVTRLPLAPRAGG